jgi:carbamoyl-phosphate synthase small subunit
MALAWLGKMSAHDSTLVTLLLECGATYSARAYGDFSKPRGSELVFCTAMSGIEESLTDPSFAGQLVLNTVSHVGNTGHNR